MKDKVRHASVVRFSTSGTLWLLLNVSDRSFRYHIMKTDLKIGFTTDLCTWFGRKIFDDVLRDP